MTQALRFQCLQDFSMSRMTSTSFALLVALMSNPDTTEWISGFLATTLRRPQVTFWRHMPDTGPYSMPMKTYVSHRMHLSPTIQHFVAPTCTTVASQNMRLSLDSEKGQIHHRSVPRETGLWIGCDHSFLDTESRLWRPNRFHERHCLMQRRQYRSLLVSSISNVRLDYLSTTLVPLRKLHPERPSEAQPLCFALRTACICS